MTRIRANLLLLLAAFIWGNAFVAQATAMEKLGPYAFVGLRYLLSAMAVLPFALLERRRGGAPLSAGDRRLVVFVGIVFLLGNVLQQIGIKHTTVTNAGFLTGLYVVMVPFMAWVAFRMPPNPIVWPAAILSIFGIFLLGGGGFDTPGTGDLLVVSSSVLWAMHVTAVGVAVMRTSRPLLVSFAQFGLCGVLSLAVAVVLEPLSLAAVSSALPELLYAGLVSGGIGFTLQVVAQRWAPPADAAVILSAEALFAALAGGLLLGERLGAIGWLGALSVFCAILIVQLVPLLRTRRAAAAP